MLQRIAHHAVSSGTLAGKQIRTLLQIGIDHGKNRLIVAHIPAEIGDNFRQAQLPTSFNTAMACDNLITAHLSGADDNAVQHAMAANAFHQRIKGFVLFHLERMVRKGMQFIQGDDNACTGAFHVFSHSYSPYLLERPLIK